MSVTVRIPRVLSQAVTSGVRHEAEGDTLAAVLDNLFTREPGLENHLLDEEGRIRPHVLIFVDALRADLDTPVGPTSEIQVLQAVSGGQESPLPAVSSPRSEATLGEVARRAGGGCGTPPFRGRNPEVDPPSWDG